MNAYTTPFPLVDDVPLPTDCRPGPRGKYPLREMEIGQSFLIPNGNPKTASPYFSVAGKRIGRKFVTRQVDGGIRVWRAA